MGEYIVERDFPLAGKIHRKDGEVELTDKQARHLRIGGFIKPKPDVSREKPKTEPAQTTEKQKVKK